LRKEIVLDNDDCKEELGQYFLSLFNRLDELESKQQSQQQNQGSGQQKQNGANNQRQNQQKNTGLSLSEQGGGVLNQQIQQPQQKKKGNIVTNALKDVVDFFTPNKKPVPVQQKQNEANNQGKNQDEVIGFGDKLPQKVNNLDSGNKQNIFGSQQQKNGINLKQDNLLKVQSNQEHIEYITKEDIFHEKENVQEFYEFLEEKAIEVAIDQTKAYNQFIEIKKNSINFKLKAFADLNNIVDEDQSTDQLVSQVNFFFNDNFKIDNKGVSIKNKVSNYKKNDLEFVSEPCSNEDFVKFFSDKYKTELQKNNSFLEDSQDNINEIRFNNPNNRQDYNIFRQGLVSRDPSNDSILDTIDLDQKIKDLDLKVNDFQLKKNPFIFKKYDLGDDRCIVEIINGNRHIQINKKTSSSIDGIKIEDKKLYDLIASKTEEDLKKLEGDQDLQNQLDDIFLQNNKAGIFSKDNKSPCYSYERETNKFLTANINLGDADLISFTKNDFKNLLKNQNDYFLVKIPNQGGNEKNQYIKFNLVFDDKEKKVIPKIDEYGPFSKNKGDIILYNVDGTRMKEESGDRIITSLITKKDLAKKLKDFKISCNLSHFDQNVLNHLGLYECNIAGDFSFKEVEQQNALNVNDNKKLSQNGGYEYIDNKQKQEYKAKQQQYFNSQLNEFFNQKDLRDKLWGNNHDNFTNYVQNTIINNQQQQQQMVPQLDKNLEKYANQLVKKYQGAVNAIEEKSNKEPSNNFEPGDCNLLNQQQQQKQ
jgi:hypothetical protein